MIVSKGCSSCGGKGHKYSNGVWVRCECLVLKAQQTLLANLGATSEDIEADVSLSGKTIASKIIDRFKEKSFPQVPVLCFGTGSSTQAFLLFLALRLVQWNSLYKISSASMLELVDSYFNDMTTFRQFLLAETLFIKMGDETPNLGAVKVVQALLARFAYKQLYPVFLSLSSPEMFFRPYPEEMLTEFNKFKVRNVQL